VKSLKIVLIVVCLAGAAVFFWMNTRNVDSIPDNPDTATNWMCATCKSVFLLSASEVADEERKLGQSAPLTCRACAAVQAYRAMQCVKCETFYIFSEEAPGGAARCPVCFPTPPNRNSPVETEPEEDELELLRL